MIKWPIELEVRVEEGGGGGIIWPIQVCATEQSMFFGGSRIVNRVY